MKTRLNPVILIWILALIAFAIAKAHGATTWTNASQTVIVQGTNTSTNTVPKWVKRNTIGNSLITDDGSTIGLNAGVHVGGTSAVADNNLLVDGEIQTVGRVGIGLAPLGSGTALTISGTGNNYSSEANSGLKIYSAGDTQLRMGADPGSDISYIQSSIEGTGTGRLLTLQPNFGNVAIGGISSAAKLAIFGGGLSLGVTNDPGVGSLALTGSIISYTNTVVRIAPDGTGYLQIVKAGAFNGTTVGLFNTTNSLLSFTIGSDGNMQWGDGVAALDTTLYRNAAGELKTGSRFVSSVGTGNAFVGTTAGGTGWAFIGTNTDSGGKRSAWLAGPTYSALFLDGNVGIGTVSPTAKLHVGPNTSTNAGLKLSEGALLATPAAGAVEMNSTNIYFTDTNGVRFKMLLNWTNYDDVSVGALTLPGGAAAPTLGDFAGASTLQVYHFDAAQDDTVYFSCQLPHTYVESAAIYPHVHWARTAAPSVAANTNVVWELNYSWSSINSPFAATTQLLLTNSVASADWTHQMSSWASIAGGTNRISSILVGRVRRLGSSSAADTYDQDVALLAIDLHVPVDHVIREP